MVDSTHDFFDCLLVSFGNAAMLRMKSFSLCFMLTIGVSGGN